MSLSSGLTLTDLSDYLAPSQICIKPVTVIEDTEDSQDDSTTSIGQSDVDKKAAAATEIVIDQATSSYYEVGSDNQRLGDKGKKLKKAEITLNDCLACSGCITSAESVLVQMQSHEEVYRVLREHPDLTPILSIAPQSVASLATLHNLSLDDTMRGLRLFFKREMGFKLVFDTTFAREISLDENRREFLERRACAAEQPQRTHVIPSPGTEASSPKSSSSGPLPILSSACPGWICYAEKTHVMPCYDKKLEASRPDFATPYAGTSKSEPIRDVDCVLTTGEVARILSDKGFELGDMVNEARSEGNAHASSGDVESTFVPSLLLAPTVGTSSGGYVHNALTAILSTLDPTSRETARIVEKKIRSDDYVEMSLVVGEQGQIVSRAIKCYGFRNLQNIVRKIGKDKGISVTRGAAGKFVRRGAASKSSTNLIGKAQEVEVEFVEVMACPGGCVNGGGQIAPPNGPVKIRRRHGIGATIVNGRPTDDEGMPDMSDMMGERSHDMVEERIFTPKEWVAEVELRYWSGGSRDNIGNVEQLVDKVVGDLVAGATNKDERRRELLRTSYRAVESEEINGLAVKW
ncbi:Cytosolic Fe-S cluster assembly factor nar1 [Microbotryomycetes sp. JL221]|nr:Cytosolic Fe-S cluster assembly factor nar1 [Microbotryomycetes sp. JL221]